MTDVDCYLPESTRGTNADLSSMYKFGILQKSGKRHLSISTEREINQKENMAVRYPLLEAGNRYLKNIVGEYHPVNGIPYYRMLGASSDQSTFVRLTNFTSGRKPSITAYLAGTYSKQEAFGNVTSQIDTSMEIGEALLINEQYIGMTNQISTSTPSTVAYPKNGSNVEIDTPFDSFSYFKWNTTSYDVSAFTFRMTQKLTGHPGDSGFYSDICENATIFGNATIVFKPNVDCSAIATDRDAGTLRAFELKILKSANVTHYLDFYVATMACQDIQLTRIQDQPDRYVGIFQVSGSIQVDVLDTVAKSHYGLS